MKMAAQASRLCSLACIEGREADENGLKERQGVTDLMTSGFLLIEEDKMIKNKTTKKKKERNKRKRKKFMR